MAPWRLQTSYYVSKKINARRFSRRTFFHDNPKSSKSTIVFESFLSCIYLSYPQSIFVSFHDCLLQSLTHSIFSLWQWTKAKASSIKLENCSWIRKRMRKERGDRNANLEVHDFCFHKIFRFISMRQLW